MNNCFWSAIVAFTSLLLWPLPILALPTPPQVISRRPPKYTPRYTCPTQVEPLTKAMLRDLPSYINRTQQKLVGKRQEQASYAIVAGRPEFQPLPIGSPEDPSANADASLRQIFFTVLERQYGEKTVSQLQGFHWLFLAQTPQGWEIALLYSRFGSYPDRPDAPLTPPRESSQSLTAQAIRRWLRDCQAGAVNPE